MAKRSDLYLTKAAKKLAAEIKSKTDLNLKLIMSAGVFAFNDADPADRRAYVSLAQLGDFGRDDQPQQVHKALDLIANVNIEILDEADAARVAAIRAAFGPAGGAEAADQDADAAEAAGKGGKGKGGRRTG